MKIVINKCFGGFGLSPLAVQELAKLNNRPCYFFTKPNYTGPYIPATLEEATSMLWWAFDVPNPNESISQPTAAEWHQMSQKEKQAHNSGYSSHDLSHHYEQERDDAKLIAVVESLGGKASDKCAELAVVEIPDGVEWEINEYDGQEHVAERHETWH